MEDGPGAKAVGSQINAASLVIYMRADLRWIGPRALRAIYLFDFIDIQAAVSSAYHLSRLTSGSSPVITASRIAARPAPGEVRHGKLIKSHSNDWLRAIINSSINYSTCPNSRRFCLYHRSPHTAYSVVNHLIGCSQELI